jgi:hypothetical protein
VPISVERRHVRLAVETLTEVTGVRPVGWMTGRPSPNTRRLLVEEGGFLYDRDALNDELPYWVGVKGRQHLVIPYSYETNDNRFDGNVAVATAQDFFTYMKDTFDVLYREGESEPGMMSHARLQDNFLLRGRRTSTEHLDLYRLPFGQIFVRGVSTAGIGALQAMLAALIEFSRDRISRAGGRSAENPVRATFVRPNDGCHRRNAGHAASQFCDAARLCTPRRDAAARIAAAVQVSIERRDRALQPAGVPNSRGPDGRTSAHLEPVRLLRQQLGRRHIGLESKDLLL